MQQGRATGRYAAVKIFLAAMVMLGLLPLGSGDAAAQAALTVSAVSPGRIALGNVLELTVEGLGAKVEQEKYDTDGLRLSLDGHPLQGLKPESVDVATNKVRFRIVRTAADKSAWSDLLGAPPISGERAVAVGLALDGTHRIVVAPKAAAPLTLAIFDPLRLAAGGVLLVLAIVIFIGLALRTDIVRDPRPVTLGARERRRAEGRGSDEQRLSAEQWCGQLGTPESRRGIVRTHSTTSCM